MSDPLYQIIYKDDPNSSSVALRGFRLSFSEIIQGKSKKRPQSVDKSKELVVNPLLFSPFSHVDSLILANIDIHLGLTGVIKPTIFQKGDKIDYIEVGKKDNISQYLRLRFDVVNQHSEDKLGNGQVSFVYNSDTNLESVYHALDLAISNSDALVTAISSPHKKEERDALFTIAQVFEDFYLFSPIATQQGTGVFIVIARYLKNPVRGYDDDFLVPFVNFDSFKYKDDQIPYKFTSYIDTQVTGVLAPSDNYLTDYNYWKLSSLLLIPSYPILQTIPKLAEGCVRETRGRGRGDFQRGRGDFQRGRGDFQRGRGDFQRGRGDFQRGRGDFQGGRGDFQRGRGDFQRGRGDFQRGRGNKNYRE